MVATVAPAHGADNVVLDNEDSGGPLLPHRGYPMWASKKKFRYTIVLYHSRSNQSLDLDNLSTSTPSRSM